MQGHNIIQLSPLYATERRAPDKISVAHAVLANADAQLQDCLDRAQLALDAVTYSCDVLENRAVLARLRRLEDKLAQTCNQHTLVRKSLSGILKDD